MQVKKFEARTMRDALEMVKNSLGPDAIILHARDNSRKFGLVGEGSVEITAAISDEILKKKKFVESKMRETDIERLKQKPAKFQKEYIEKAVHRYIEKKEPMLRSTQIPYIDILDDQTEQNLTSNATRGQPSHRSFSQNFSPPPVTTTAPLSPPPSPPPVTTTAPLSPPPSTPPVTTTAPLSQPPLFSQHQVPPTIVPSEDIENLKKEVESLKKVLEQFQNIPQSIMAARHPGASFGIPYELSYMFEKLTLAGMSSEITANILLKIQSELPPIKFRNKSMLDAWVAKHIIDTTRIIGLKNHEKVQLFVGPSGSGKTASLVKLASHFVVREHKKVALATTDTTKIGAVDQLRIYAQILNVPFAILRKSSDWDYVLNRLQFCDFIFCDFPGRSLKNLDEVQMIKDLLPMKTNIASDIHLVLSATEKDEECIELGKRYSSLQYNDIIFTRLDEAIRHGSIYNFMRVFETPLHSFGIGPKVPEDFEMASKERILDLMLKLTKRNLTQTEHKGDQI